MQIVDFLSLLDGVKGSGKQYIAKCPAHEDHRQSLSVSVGKDGRILAKCHAGCSIDTIAGAMGITTSDLFPSQEMPKSEQQRQLVATYDYTDETGKLLHQKLRYNNKSFSQRRPDGKGGWVYNLKGITPVLYNLPAVVESNVVFVVEGEKDCDTLQQYGKTATCGTHGAGPGKWLSHYNSYLIGKSIIIIQDNDDVGKAFALEIASSLHSVADSVKLIDLTQAYSTLPEHGDISDVLELMGRSGMVEVEQLIADTPEYDLQIGPEVESLKLICLEDVESQHTEWLWRPYIPRGKITLMQGDPGQGKTMLSLAIASIVSTGDAFYGDDDTKRTADAVIYQTAEDGIEDTIKPRLVRMKPNFKNIFVIDESQEGLTLSDSRIEQVLKQKRPALMIIDPLQAYLGAGVDMHRANEVRPILSRLGRLAEQYRCAIILIMHMAKMSRSSALQRGLGSIDIPAAARSVLVVGSNPDNPDEKIMAHEKSSLARHGKSVAFHIDFDNGGIVFDGFSELTANQIITPKKEAKNRGSGTFDDAVELLERLLGYNGFAQLDDIMAAAREAGVSKSTLYRARGDLALKTLTLGFSSDRKTWWMHSDVKKADILGEQDVVRIEQASFAGTWPPA